VVPLRTVEDQVVVVGEGVDEEQGVAHARKYPIISKRPILRECPIVRKDALLGTRRQQGVLPGKQPLSPAR